MEVSIVDISEFIYSTSSGNKSLSTHWVKPFLDFEKAKEYALKILEEEGYSTNFIYDSIQEEEKWDGKFLQENYTSYQTSEIGATPDESKKLYKRFEGHRVMVQDYKSQMQKTIYIIIQTEEAD